MMEVAKVERRLQASPDAVWEELRRFGGVEAWIDGVSECTLEGWGVGAVRTVVRNGRTARERLLELDDQARRLSYAVLAPHALPARDVVGVLEVAEAQGGGARVTWRTQAQVEGDAETLRGYIEPFYAASLAKLETRLRGANL